MFFFSPRQLKCTVLIRGFSFCRRPSERHHLESHLDRTGLDGGSRLQRRLSARRRLLLVLQQSLYSSAHWLGPHNARSDSK